MVEGSCPGFTHEVPKVEFYAYLGNCKSPLALRGAVVSKPRGVIAGRCYQGTLPSSLILPEAAQARDRCNKVPALPKSTSHSSVFSPETFRYRLREADYRRYCRAAAQPHPDPASSDNICRPRAEPGCAWRVR